MSSLDKIEVVIAKVATSSQTSYYPFGHDLIFIGQRLKDLMGLMLMHCCRLRNHKGY